MMILEVLMDPLFNSSAAAWARDLVMKMDDGEAQEFVTHVTRAVLLEDIENNRRTVNNHIREVNKRLLDAASKVVSKGVLSPLDVVVEVSKAIGDDPFNRDTHGRFAHVESRVRTNRNIRPMPQSLERQQGIPSAKKIASASGIKGKKLTPRERSAYQQQYIALADKLEESVSSGGKTVQAILQDKGTGRRSVIDVSSMDNIAGWNPSTQDIVALRSDLPGTQAGVASFDLVSSLGSHGMANTAQRTTQGVQRGGHAFADEWNDASRDTAGTNERTYRRISAGSKLLGEVTPATSKLHAAAKFGEYVGEFGPEAEKVIGPHARKTAYRYRGIERRPDKELIDARNSRVRQMEVPESDQSVAQIAARRVSGGSTVDAEGKARASIAVSTEYLMNRLPNMKLAEIQRKSGRIPPSEGVIIDRNGNIAVQAVGHADDHYLPFNLKNLKSLRGGEYVRTRSKGGITSEDIYTGLVSGARQVTVVSNSGVFTVNFEDDFRGVRRYNDKAATMVDRYAKTLDAIKGGEIEREPLSLEQRAKIRGEVEQEMGSWASRPEMEAEIRNRIQSTRSEEISIPTTDELKAVDDFAHRHGKNEGDRNRIRAQRLDALMEAKASRFYQLDGEGYAAALESLREQYPYYIKNVTFMTKREALNGSGERQDPNNYPGAVRLSNGRLVNFSGAADQGYVKARHNRPDEVLEGFYDAEIAGAGELAGTGKTKASHVNYQNWEHNPVNPKRTRRAAEPTAEGAPAAAAAPAAPRTPQAAVRESAARLEYIQRNRQTVKELTDHLAPQFSEEDPGTFTKYSTLFAAAKDFNSIYDDAAKRAVLMSQIRAAHREYGEHRPQEASTLDQQMRLMDRTSGLSGGVQWSGDLLGQRGNEPYSFNGDAYVLGAAPDTVRKETAAVRSKLAPNLQKLPDDIDDDTLASMAASQGRAALAIRSNKSADDPDVVDSILQATQDVFGALGVQGSQASTELQLRSIRNASEENRKRIAEVYAQNAESLQRMRRLKATQTFSQPTTPPARQVTAESERKPFEVPEAPKTRDFKEDATMLENAANILGKTDDTAASDYRDVAEYLRRGDYRRARDLAQSLNEDDRTRAALLKSIFPDIDEPHH